MASVEWIKIMTDMFDHRKIKYLRRLPNGSDIALIWVMLLTMAGRCNANGMIFLTENIPYTPEILADELGFEEKTVNLALSTFEQLDMIVVNNGFFSIAGWDEYQNVDGLEKIREQNRLRQAKYKQKQKTSNGNVTVTLPVTLGNATDKEIDIDKDIDIDIEDKPKRKRFVPPTLKEVATYCFERKNNVDAQKFVDYYESNGWKVGKNKMKSWQAAVRTWEKNSFDKPAKTGRQTFSNIDERKYTEEQLRELIPDPTLKFMEDD